jgi:[ribosomal protein S18]-alanine N-acetyltransferase
VRSEAFQIIPMARAHRKACEAITAVSEPWKTLKECINFPKFIALKQAYICIVQKEIAGFLVFSPEPIFARGGYLRAIGVEPSMRGHGVGSALLSFAENKTARVSDNLYLCVSSFNRQAQVFYKKHGYVLAGKLPDLIKKGAAEHIYWKRLKP